MDYIEYVIKAKEGDEKSLEYLVNRFQNMAVSYAYSIIRDFQKAEDAAQEAFILLFRNIHNLKEPSAFISWLRKLIFNICYRVLQRQKFEICIDDIEESIDVDNNPYHYIEKKERDSLVESALLQLNEGQREVFLLHYTFDKSYEEIAIDLQITESAVANRLYSGKKKLKAIMLNTMEEYLGGYAMNKEEFTKKVLENIHKLVKWDAGQNYPFNGCMAYLMEQLGEKEYDYWFFAGLSGDSFSQVYGDAESVSYALFGYDYLKRIFDTLGYEFTLVSRKELNSSKEKYIQKIMDYINKGTPVIMKGDGLKRGFKIICGYEDDGKTLLVLNGDNPEPQRWGMEVHVNEGRDIEENWIFVGNQFKKANIAEIYHKVVMEIPKLLTMEKVNGCSFGRNAFIDWADDIENGRFDNVKPEEFDGWDQYSKYVCNLATNSIPAGHPTGWGFLDKALEYNPDITFVNDISKTYKDKNVLWSELEAIGGGFNVTLDILKDTKKRKIIADKIREFAKCCDDTLAAFDKLK